MQHAINTEADHRHITLGFEMNIRGALIKCKLPQPVNDIDNVLIIRIDLFIRLTKFNQLLEILSQAEVITAGFARIFNRFRQ